MGLQDWAAREDSADADKPHAEASDDTEEPFGLLVYRALKRHRSGNLVTMNLKYAEIQELKVADRKATLALFPKPEYLELQALKTAPPEGVAELYVDRAEREAQAAQRRSFFWPFWFPMFFR